MWHENEQEMTQILTSLMRMDKHEAGRRNKPNDGKTLKYSFNIHVLFDDAFEKLKGGLRPNKWVNQLCVLIRVAANKVEKEAGYNMPDPIIYPTPYGARLEFMLPNNNLMYVHLKNKDKIRHRKRWSQCMYLYYLLGFIGVEKKIRKIEDTFILALDGDVDFQPKAAEALLERMLRNDKVGAACGRIHPVGSGPVVWFQKFEYAVGHWLQKTAEHVLGCVLCSPGCFSMFRGEALADVNVTRTYVTRPTKALHYLQWDQGEDRWLCTLLLKRGWRIEYSAASDSYTFAPEGFNEFYNQRRRWGPSTMANVIDILSDASITVKNNDYVNWFYISYQGSLMASSILGPATVIMMVAGAFSYIFSWSATAGILVSVIPVIIYIIICYTTSKNIQLAVAGILTIVYALVMMAVVVGVVGSLASSTLLDPNNLFYVVLAGLYLFTGLAHPGELTCLFSAPLYYLMVPSAFIFLMVYSLNNMDDVSWGTREVKQPEVIEESPEDKNEENQSGLSKHLKYSDENGYYECGLGNLCKCFMCINDSSMGYYKPLPTNNNAVEKQQLRRKTTMHRKKTMTKTKEQMLEEFSKAKADNYGENAEKFKKRMSRMSITAKQAKKLQLETNDKEELTTGKIRKLSRMSRSNSKMKRTTQIEMNNEAQNEARKKALELESLVWNDNLSDKTNISEVYSSEDEEIDSLREEEEQNESIDWIQDGELENCPIKLLKPFFFALI